MVELDHPFATSKPADETYAAILDLDRLIPCVEGGKGGATIHTAVQISGKAASMGEGVVVTVLDALIKDFAGKLATM